MDFALTLGGLDHGVADAVFNAVDGVGAFKFGNYAGVSSGSDAVELYQRGVADEVDDVLAIFMDESSTRRESVVSSVDACG
jgi:hypothetical protein